MCHNTWRSEGPVHTGKEFCGYTSVFFYYCSASCPHGDGIFRASKCYFLKTGSRVKQSLSTSLVFLPKQSKHNLSKTMTQQTHILPNL